MPTEKSAIEWTDSTWNPVTGCSRVSDGCRHCYAEALSLRYGWTKKPWTHVNAAENVVLHPERLDQPLRWKKPRMVFVNSMSDLFHEQVPGEYITRVFERMRQCPQHTFQVLTKRPERMLDFCRAYYARSPKPLPNVWLGVSVENQRAADERIPLLLKTPAAVRFLSCEPLLSEVDLAPWLTFGPEKAEWCLAHYGASQPLSWVICGGESGLRHRPMQAEWARSLRDQCQAVGVAYFFKQWGGRTPKAGGRLLDGRTWDEMPPVRESA